MGEDGVLAGLEMKSPAEMMTLTMMGMRIRVFCGGGVGSDGGDDARRCFELCASVLQCRWRRVRGHLVL